MKYIHTVTCPHCGSQLKAYGSVDTRSQELHYNKMYCEWQDTDNEALDNQEFCKKSFTVSIGVMTYVESVLVSV